METQEPFQEEHKTKIIQISQKDFRAMGGEYQDSETLEELEQERNREKALQKSIENGNYYRDTRKHNS